MRRKLVAFALSLGFLAAAYSGDIKPALEWRKTIRKYFDDNSIELYKLPISICCHVSSGVKALGCFEYFE